MFSKSKVVPPGLSQPRAELLAATLNIHTGEIVKRYFQDNQNGSVKLSDSQVTLHWINNKKLKKNQVDEKQGSGNKQIYSTKALDVYEK